MALFDIPTRFMQDGTEYEHADLQPELVPGSVRRFTYGTEPHVIAAIPLEGGGTVEVHGYATHYNRDWVSVAWTDDEYSYCVCWVPAKDVRRPGGDEWRGKFVQF